MSVVRYRVPWRVQPQGAVALNLGYPGAGRITTLIPFGVVNRDIVGNKALTLSSGGSIQPDPRGLTLKGSGSAAVTSLALNLSAYNKLTVSFWGYWDAFANDDKFFGEFTANSNSNNGFYIDPNSSTTNFAIQAGNSTPLRKTAHFPRPSAATWHHYLFTFDTTTGAGSSGLTAYVDGVLQTLTWVNTDNMASSAFANDTMYFFSRNNASLFGAGRMQNFVIRGGYVGTQLDASYEYANGWQLFSPLPRTLWAPAAAGGGTTYTITPSGGIVFAGTGTETNTKIFLPTGGVTFAGTGNATFAGGGTTYTITPTGGITFSGSATQTRTKIVLPTGGFSFSGTGNEIDTKVIIPSGGVAFGGTGSMTSNTVTVTGPQGERTKVGVGN